ncbi:hypothetical protein BDV38DRAFT_136895 [Aspergillus pseudotamarii]|uniref:Uncharacterized protein n=1 Tax=Aspergillus pseudotamarii TaxID=132259 RepID=A0A5N6SP91_ASPPS|nr:uncharacterized protein BDV38DRAFT_136895 [Aspergillus pseudotamarii]KAE8135541.1 hypothetical protein BDV38DRAFT_136895 [Aspergillus pseudotamarii]
MTEIHDAVAKEGTPFAAFNTPGPITPVKYRPTWPKLQPDEPTVTTTPTTSTAFTSSTRPAATVLTAPGATPAQAGYQCCPGPKLHTSCYSSGPYVGVIPTHTYCPKAAGFPGHCVCRPVDVSDPVIPKPYHPDVFEVNKPMAVSTASSSGKPMYQVPYLVEEDRKFWFHAPNGDCMHLTVKQIAEKQCVGRWANTCTGQPYYVCLPKDRIRYDAKDFNAVFQMSGLSHIEFHKRYQPF